MMWSVIIPTYQRNLLLAKCLECLKPEVQTLDPSLYEVIITDDGKEVSAKEMVKEHYPWAKWKPGPQKGPAANRNNGAKHAKNIFLVFIDDDCLPNPDLLEAYHKAKDLHKDEKVMEGRIYADRPRERLDEESPINETGGYLWSCNFAIEKKTFWEIGGFDERFLHAAMEDVELHYRIKKSGIVPCFVKEAAVCHPWRKTPNILNKCFKKEESLIVFLEKYPQEGDRLGFKHFMFSFSRTLFKTYLPGLIKFKFKGAFSEGIRILYLVKFSLIQTKLKWKKTIQ